MINHIHTSESVSPGHPDKLADQISDAILDECLATDPTSRVAIETLLTRGLAVIAGELSCKGYINIPKIVRQTINNAGYTNTDLGLNGHACGVMVAVQGQSPDIAVGVNTGGAGDQGIMFGYACTDTPELMPLPISVAHSLMHRAEKTRQEIPHLGFRPDAKGQVSVLYKNGKPEKIDTVVLSIQHVPELNHEEVVALVKQHIIEPVMDQYSSYSDPNMKLHINPTGVFIIGGPHADTGLTGRKIIVDTYGGMCPHGGGAFSGKDPTKVDRSAAYMARHIAKCIVAAGLAERAQIALAYAIGVEQPVAINIETFGTEQEDLEKIEKEIRKSFDLSPLGITKHLNLREIKYLPTARNGHFGHAEFPWEATEPAKALKAS